MSEVEQTKPRSRTGAVLYAVAVAVLALDQLTKALIVASYQVGDSVAILGPVLSFTRRTNTGGAFSVLQNHPAALMAITAGVLLLLLLAGPRFAGSRPSALVALGLIAGGAGGNLLDRLRLGHVVDFLDFHCWPVFNVADVGITVGAGLLLLTAFLTDKPKRGDR